MNAPAHPRVELTLRYRTADPYDASIRLLNDAQRFGAELVSLSFAARDGVLTVVLRVASQIDCANLRDRLARHRAVASLEPVA